MDFLAPLMLIGAAGVAIPIAVHLIGRRRARRVPFAAVDFLLGTDRKLARKLRLRELLLLLARILVCVGIPIALAKPYTACEQQGPAVESGPQAAVIVIDDSLVTRASAGGERLIERARERATRIVQRLGPEAEIAVLTTSQGGEGAGELSRNHLGLRDQISEIRASYAPAQTTAALARAADMLATSSYETRTVFLVSALTARGLEGGAPWPEGAGPALRIVDLTDGEPIGNAAVIALEVERDPNAGSRGIVVSAEIANYSHEPMVERGISLSVAGQVASRGVVSVEPGGRTRKQFAASLPTDARRSEITVALAPDALPADDRRHAIAELRSQVQVLLVNGDPRTIKHEDELFYLRAALRPGDRADSGFGTATATASELGDLDLAEFDVAILANVHALPPAAVSRLAQWVRGGGGLMIATGSNTDADAYNKTMSELLPQRLQSVLDTVYGKRGSEREGRALRLAKLDVDHPIFAAFTADSAALRDARFRTVMLLGPTTRVERRRVLARYESGAAALVEGALGKGRLLLFTSSIDRDWTDLPIHPGYLPLVQQSARYLARRATADTGSEVFVGRSLSLAAGDTDTRLEVRTPDARSVVLEGDRLATRDNVRFNETSAPGIYKLWSVNEAGVEQRRTELDFAVNVDPLASNLERVEQLPRSGGGASVESTRHRRRVELWHALAAVLLGLMLVESLLLLRS